MPRCQPRRASATPASISGALLLSLVLGAFPERLPAQTPAQTPASNPARPSAAIPSAQPTNSFANSAVAPADTAATAPRPPHRSHVAFSGGLLTVSASNASLNGLIREIARQTGMKVSGSVAEDRVFGDYGPGDPQVVLATLLDGTGSNILILSSSSDSPLELILTPRTGAATPPSANQNVADDDSDSDNQPPPGAPAPISTMRGRARATVGNPSSTGQNSVPAAPETVTFPPADETSAPASAATAGAAVPAGSSTDTVKTPQQIFEQLQRLRQQNNSATPQ